MQRRANGPPKLWTSRIKRHTQKERKLNKFVYTKQIRSCTGKVVVPLSHRINKTACSVFGRRLFGRTAGCCLWNAFYACASVHTSQRRWWWCGVCVLVAHFLRSHFRTLHSDSAIRWFSAKCDERTRVCASSWCNWCDKEAQSEGRRTGMCPLGGMFFSVLCLQKVGENG